MRKKYSNNEGIRVLPGKAFFSFPGDFVNGFYLVNKPCFMYNQKKIEYAVLFGGELYEKQKNRSRAFWRPIF
jgi:hypothetical protein